MRALTILAGLIFASGLSVAEEPEWCEVEKNYPMERRGIGCIELCDQWRKSAGVDISEPICRAEWYAYYTFEDVDFEDEELVCVVSVKCVDGGGN